MYQPYAHQLAAFGFFVLQYNLPHLKRTDFDTEVCSRLFTWLVAFETSVSTRIACAAS